MKLLEELHGRPGGARKGINSELWHACAGPLVSLPPPGNLVYYFPQGHTEQVTVSTKRMANAHIPCYPNLTSQMMCQVHNVTLHADKETDEIYAQITLQPVNSENDVFPIPDFGQTKSKQPTEFFCKTLTASDTSTHGGFSVPRRAAEKLFPPLDHSLQPPSQELTVRDLHDNTWTFRHIYRGQPKRHLLTTGWSVFVGAKRLKAGDSVLFIRDENSQLLLGVRRANRQQTVLPSSVLSADSMHIGVLAAAAHASANRTPFTIYYNPRACPSEFVVSLAKYHKATYGTQISIGMRFGMMFEAEDSSKRRYMGTIMGISDVDPLRWPNSKWRNLQVEWDEHGCIERPSRVSLWEIETPENFFNFPSSTSTLKRPYYSDLIEANGKHMIKRPFQQVPDPTDVIKFLLKPQTPNPYFQVRCHSSMYVSLMQNVAKCESPIPPPAPSGIHNQGNQLLHDILHQTGNPNDISTSFPQKLPLQCLKQENPNISDCEAVVSDSNHQVSSLSDVPNSPPPEVNNIQEGFAESKVSSPVSEREKNLDSHIDNVDMASAKESNKLDANTDIVFNPALQLQSKKSREDVDKKQKCDAEVNHSGSLKLNHDPALLLERGFSMQGHKIDETEPAMLNFTDPSTLPPDKNHQSQLDKCFLDDLGWMLQSSCGSPCLQEMKHPESFSPFGNVDMTSFYSSDNSRATSADISAVVNPENFTSTCTSEQSADQCLLAFAQDSLGSQLPNNTIVPSSFVEQSTGCLEQFASRITSVDMHKAITASQGISYPNELKCFMDGDNGKGEIFGPPEFQVSNGNVITARPVPKTTDVVFSSGLTVPSKGMTCNLESYQDVQSQVTSSLTDFSLRDLPGNSGGVSSSNIDTGENSQLNNNYLWKQVSHPMRTYTKVQKLGSVGRCIDVTRFRNYDELISAIACMFGLGDHLRGSEWKLVYVDYENDMLLVGDDPWEEFVNCAHCIRILSPAEVQLMSDEGLPGINDPGDVGAFGIEQSPFLNEAFVLCEENR